MACQDNANEQDWIDELKSGGAVPLLEPENCPNGWATPPSDKFMVRGPEYFTSKVKIPGGEYLLKPLGFDWIKSPCKICEILKKPYGRVKKAVDNELAMGKKKPFVWAFNLQLPGRDNYCAVAYFLAVEPISEGSLIDRFIKGDDSFRNSRLKLIANIVKGPWIVRAAVGEQAICILGRAVSCKYVVGDNFIEVDIDIGSSMVANTIVHLAFGYITTLTVDLAFLIESQVDTELPERILGAVRFSELNPASANVVEPPPSEENAGNLQPSVPTGFWISLGQGFSNFLHINAQGGPSSDSARGNSSVHELKCEEGTKNW